jgi:hypothetical protein
VSQVASRRWCMKILRGWGGVARTSRDTSRGHTTGMQSKVHPTYKAIVGEGLRARSPAGQRSETVLGCEILNRMTALGRPSPYRVSN